VLQPGNEVHAVWRARLTEHLGSYAIEPLRQRAAALLDEPARLAGLAAACALVEAAVPEREPHPALHAGLLALLDSLAGSEAWAAVYVRFEMGLLQELGFGLDLDRCAVTGTAENLAFVSPRTGRAVSREAAGPWREKLLALPPFLLGTQAGGLGRDDVVHGLALTGHFLERHVLAPAAKPMPAARTRFVEYLGNADTTSGAILLA
jgi:DNA repair protein RecO (recombination protein O)